MLKLITLSIYEKLKLLVTKQSTTSLGIILNFNKPVFHRGIYE